MPLVSHLVYIYFFACNRAEDTYIFEEENEKYKIYFQFHFAYDLLILFNGTLAPDFKGIF